PRHRAGLPAVRAAPGHRGRAHGKEEVMTALLETPTAGKQTLRPTRKVAWGSPMTYVVAFLFVGICIGPVLYIILGGFRTNAQITADPSGLPGPWVVDNYLEVLASPIFWRQVGNSAVAGVLTTLGVVALGLMVSFVLARYDFKLNGAMYSLFAAGLMFPMTLAITPLYILIRDLGLMNTIGGIVLPQIAFALPTTIIILVPFLRAIPKEIEEAAAIDGSGRLGFFFRMVVPL